MSEVIWTVVTEMPKARFHRRLAVAGIVLGAGASLLVTGWIRGLLFGVAAFDPATLAAVAAIFSVVAFVACLLPALRAARPDIVPALAGDGVGVFRRSRLQGALVSGRRAADAVQRRS